MRSIAFADFLIGVGILFVLEGLTPDNMLRMVGIGSAVVGFILIWLVRR